jgi:hypothetical protein
MNEYFEFAVPHLQRFYILLLEDFVWLGGHADRILRLWQYPALLYFSGCIDLLARCGFPILHDYISMKGPMSYFDLCPFKNLCPSKPLIDMQQIYYSGLENVTHVPVFFNVCCISLATVLTGLVLILTTDVLGRAGAECIKKHILICHLFILEFYDRVMFHAYSTKVFNAYRSQF